MSTQWDRPIFFLLDEATILGPMQAQLPEGVIAQEQVTQGAAVVDFSDLGIEEAVGVALGMASVCWVELEGQQVFDSDRAGMIRDALMDRIAAVLR